MAVAVIVSRQPTNPAHPNCRSAANSWLPSRTSPLRHRVAASQRSSLAREPVMPRARPTSRTRATMHPMLAAAACSRRGTTLPPHQHPLQKTSATPHQPSSLCRWPMKVTLRHRSRDCSLLTFPTHPPARCGCSTACGGTEVATERLGWCWLTSGGDSVTFGSRVVWLLADIQFFFGKGFLMSTFLLWAAMVIAPAAGLDLGTPAAGCDACGCCGCCVTGVCSCDDCSCCCCSDDSCGCDSGCCTQDADRS